MKLLTGLFRAARKRLMTTDNDMGFFREKLNKLVDGGLVLARKEGKWTYYSLCKEGFKKARCFMEEIENQVE